MKAMIFAAGLGTRLKPLTDTLPKALVPVAGRPMLEHVIVKLKAAGFTEIVVNIHHLGGQIIDFLQANRENYGITIHISDERGCLLDTGGGIKKARAFFENTTEPFLVHNVDILSDIDLREFYQYHLSHNEVATLLVSQRQTVRYLLFDTDSRLCGWINKETLCTRPEGFSFETNTYHEYAFSGIHILSPEIFRVMDSAHYEGAFSVMDFYLSICRNHCLKGYLKESLRLIDIGKLETLAKAERFIIEK